MAPLAKVRIAGIDLLLGILVILAWTLGGGLQALAAGWQASGLSPLLAGLGLILSFLLIGWLIELPLGLWRTFRLEARFGFNRSSPGRFAKDQLLGLLLALLLGAPLAAIMLGLMQGAGALWWLWAWGYGSASPCC